MFRNAFKGALPAAAHHVSKTRNPAGSAAQAEQHTPSHPAEGSAPPRTRPPGAQGLSRASMPERQKTQQRQITTVMYPNTTQNGVAIPGHIQTQLSEPERKMALDIMKRDPLPEQLQNFTKGQLEVLRNDFQKKVVALGASPNKDAGELEPSRRDQGVHPDGTPFEIAAPLYRLRRVSDDPVIDINNTARVENFEIEHSIEEDLAEKDMITLLVDVLTRNSQAEDGTLSYAVTGVNSPFEGRTTTNCVETLQQQRNEIGKGSGPNAEHGTRPEDIFRHIENPENT